ncbi:unnamed protein product [Dibothriocephalus latus]|uniref:Uncharacterized protein n=1 Tax=Dibothriocephalus latus TaxID=60516 RepID=A0A3P7P0I3_DIBLA|nr:unnamed protein product [Dibothriocephalus latus]
MLGAAGSETVVKEAFARFDRHYKAIVENATGDAHKPEDVIPADLRVAIYSTVIRHGGEEEFNRLLCLVLLRILLTAVRLLVVLESGSLMAELGACVP